MSASPEFSERVVAVVTAAEEAVGAAEGGTPVVVADPDARRAGEAAAEVERAGGRAACFAMGQAPDEEERAAVEALAAEILGATGVAWR